MRKIIWVIVSSVVISSTLFVSQVHAGSVDELETLLNNNQDLKKQFGKGFTAQDRNSHWYRKSLTDFYVFFNEWLVFNPRVNTAKEFVDKFKRFYTLPNDGENINEAVKAIRDPRFSSWLESFVEKRGVYLDSNKSKYIAYEWARDSEVSVGLYEIPQKGFESFNDFFTRKLKKGVRPIYGKSSSQSFVSPADCEVWEDSGWLDKEDKVEVKNDKYNLSELLGDSSISMKYKGGKAAVCFLMPDNYHRFHSPIDGKVTYRKDMDGLYFGAKGFVDHFHERRRSVYEIQASNGKHIAITSIGIATISSVNLSKNVGDAVEKGEEIGSFSYGGSALVLLFETGLLKEFVFEEGTHPYRYRSTKIQMGQKLGTFN